MKILAIALCFLLGSCTTLKYAKNEKILTKKGCMPIAVHSLSSVEVELDDMKQIFIFDTGAMGSVIIDSTAIKGFSMKKFGTFGATAGADRKKTKNKWLTAKLSTPLFESKNKLLAFSALPESTCYKKAYFQGVLGLDAFFDKGTALLLNFTKNEICNVEITEIAEKLKLEPGYKLLKSKCYNNQVFVYLFIEGKEFKFKLDTGYTESFVIPYSKKLPFKNANSLTLVGRMYKTVSSETEGKEVFYEKIPMQFAEIDFGGKLSVSSSIKAQNMGLRFIKCFDWIIDYENNKVFVKRNENQIESTFKRKVSYYAKAERDKLIISTKEISQTKYHLGDEITLVNGQKVTAHNNCEMQDLLNKTDDWNTLQLEVVPSTK